MPELCFLVKHFFVSCILFIFLFFSSFDLCLWILNFPILSISVTVLLPCDGQYEYKDNNKKTVLISDCLWRPCHILTSSCLISGVPGSHGNAVVMVWVHKWSPSLCWWAGGLLKARLLTATLSSILSLQMGTFSTAIRDAQDVIFSNDE